MERFTISLDGELAKEFDALIAERGYGNRSEAVRDIIRAQLEAWRLKQDEAPHCVANLSYVSQSSRARTCRATDDDPA